jgi:RimJ/RimL family protein N-acetyltransferase
VALPPFPIETERLLLRPFVEDDLDGLVAMHSVPEVARYLYSEPRGRDDVVALLPEKMRRTTLRDEGDALNLAAVLRETGALVGDVTLIWRSRAHAQGEVGYIVNPAYQGRGLATEATRVLLRVGFEDLGLHRLFGRLDGRNAASARVLERLGMRREAHLVENEHVKGEWTDEIVYAMLAREWRELERAVLPDGDGDGVAIEPLGADDWPAVAAIYREGLAGGLATFETDVPSWDEWSEGHLADHRVVARVTGGPVLGWAALSRVSDRCVYTGVAEVSVYVAAAARRRRIGQRLLAALADGAEGAGIWTLQAGIFPENAASVRLHQSAGFRIVGVRERLGRLGGAWRDVLLLERRSRRL